VDFAVIAIAVSIACTLTIIVAAVQVPAMRRSLQAITYRSATTAMQPYWDLLAAYPQLHPVLHGVSGLDSLSTQDRVRAEVAWSMRMDWHQSVIVQQAVYGSFTQTMADTWAAQLRDDLRAAAFQELWERLGARYHPAMRAWVSTELAVIRAGG
jgi:hypothetical protein